MKHSLGFLLRLVGHLITLLTLVAACIYAVFVIMWLHAPALGVLTVIAPFALPALGIAWLCRIGGRRLQHPRMAAPYWRTQRWLQTGLGVAIVVVLVTLVRDGVNEYRCSVARSRDPVAHALETRTNGFERVCTGDLARFDIAFTSLANATRKLAFTPVDLTHTPFAQLELIGARPETVVDVRSRLYRGFRLPDGHRVTLLEQDMSADGSTSWRNPKDEPERINGLPARLVVLDDAAGEAVSLLSWTEGRRDYELWVDANVVRLPLRARLFALAASIPHAVPACPNEPPLKPMHIGADGYRVVEPAAPPTPAEMDILLKKTPRPCK